MKYVFIVQGEGRGHMTQAMAMYDLLLANGHTVCEVMVGKSQRREIPKFFTNHILCPVSSFESPNFVTDKKNKGIKIGATIWQNLLKQGVFWKNMGVINKKIKTHQPDVVVNFYDLLYGMYSAIYRPKVRTLVIGHQYLLDHPEFEFPVGKHGLDKTLIHNNSAITASRAVKKLALSFRHMPDLPKEKIYVVPPLLRKEVLAQVPEQGEHILAYAVNDGYGDEMMAWHEKNRDVKVEFFWDRKGVENPFKPHENLTFHQLDDVKFLEKMRTSRGYVSSAGFESICEALYMAKPVMMIPTGGHFEQLCNAIDAIKAGAGMQSTSFDLTSFLAYLPTHQSKHDDFKQWVGSADALFLKHLTEW